MEMNPYQYQKMMDFFNNAERVEKVIQQGKAEEFWTFGIEDFVTLLQRVINTSWKNSNGTSWGTFSYEEPQSLTESNENGQGEGIFPWITFDVLERTPSQSHKGLKPRQFEHVIDPNNEDDYFRLHRMWYDCYVEFAIFAPTNKEAVNTQTRFESLLHQYTGLFKEMGVSDIVFKREIGSKNANASKWNKDIPHRTVTYLIRIERIVAVRHSLLHAVEAEIRAELIDGLKENAQTETLVQYFSTKDGEYLLSNNSEFMQLYNEHYSNPNSEEEK